MTELRIVFTGPPGPEPGRFIEVENELGESLDAGEWRERPDGHWELVIHADEKRRCCNTRWSEGHRGTCRLSLMQGGTNAHRMFDQ